jgi:cyclohexanecarboxylate-CoA ligase
MDLGVILPPERIAAMEARGDWAGKTTLDYLDAALAQDPGRIALIAHDGEAGATATFTYAELDKVVRRIAHGLAALGVAPGDVVSFQLPNWWQFTALHLACIHVGAISNPLMPIFRARELRFMLGFAEAKV